MGSYLRTTHEFFGRCIGRRVVVMDASDGGLRCFSRAGHAGRQRSRPHLKLDWLLVLPASVALCGVWLEELVHNIPPFDHVAGSSRFPRGPTPEADGSLRVAGRDREPTAV